MENIVCLYENFVRCIYICILRSIFCLMFSDAYPNWSTLVLEKIISLLFLQR